MNLPIDLILPSGTHVRACWASAARESQEAFSQTRPYRTHRMTTDLALTLLVLSPPILVVICLILFVYALMKKKWAIRHKWLKPKPDHF
jgi:hypothetical protein